MRRAELRQRFQTGSRLAGRDLGAPPLLEGGGMVRERRLTIAGHHGHRRTRANQCDAEPRSDDRPYAHRCKSYATCGLVKLMSP